MSRSTKVENANSKNSSKPRFHLSKTPSDGGPSTPWGATFDLLHLLLTRYRCHSCQWQYPEIPTTIITMGVHITTIAYLRVLIIEIGSTIFWMVVEAQGIHGLPGQLIMTASPVLWTGWPTGLEALIVLTLQQLNEGFVVKHPINSWSWVIFVSSISMLGTWPNGTCWLEIGWNWKVAGYKRFDNLSTFSLFTFARPSQTLRSCKGHGVTQLYKPKWARQNCT